jgi:hypothetical protein
MQRFGKMGKTSGLCPRGQLHGKGLIKIKGRMEIVAMGAGIKQNAPGCRYENGAGLGE